MDPQGHSSSIENKPAAGADGGDGGKQTTPAPGQGQGAAQGGQEKPAAPAAGAQDGGKKPEGQGAADAASGDFEPKLPDGRAVDEKLLDGFKALVKESGLKGEHAQKVVDLFLEAQDRAAEQMKAAYEERTKGWDKELAADKTFGGDNLKKTVAAIERYVTKYSDDADVKRMKEDGALNYPPFVRAMARAQFDMDEDSTGGKAKSEPGGAPTTTDPEAAKKQFARKFYKDSMPERR